MDIMDLNMMTINPIKHSSIDELLCNYFNCEFNRLNELYIIQEEIETQLKISIQELKHTLMIQGNWGFCDEKGNFYYWKSESCKEEDFLHTIVRNLLEVNKSKLNEDEDIRFEQITLLAVEGHKINKNLTKVRV